VNRTLADRYFAGERAIGKGVDGVGLRWKTIVGVVADTRNDGLRNAAMAELYLPLTAAKPRGGGGITRDHGCNLVIRTATHSYLFELRVVSTNWKSMDQAKRDGVQYRILFAYPADTHFAAAPVVPPPPPLQARLDPHRRYDFDYDVATTTHERWLVPDAVYDDGRFTYIRLQDVDGMPTSNFPAVFARERVEGEDFVVNTTVEGDTLKGTAEREGGQSRPFEAKRK
jgi:hypothetical protein